MSPRHARIFTFDDATPSKALETMYVGLSRPQCSVLAQLRTGHIGFNAYLHRFKLVPSPLCSHCNAPESVPHLLLTSDTKTTLLRYYLCLQRDLYLLFRPFLLPYLSLT
jgi:hypothetical protein